MGTTISRLRVAFNPPEVAKSKNVLRFGILGVANIVPLALLGPAKSHPEVVIQVVASRSREKAVAFAKKHGIPEARDSYQDVLDDPDIDCLFIPLPNSMHYEWTVRAIRAGKHVLLEKPSVSNAKEAEVLFNLPELSEPNGPILMEAFHNRFHPAWALFSSLIKSGEVVHAAARSMIPWWSTSKDDIAFNYSLSGGTMMHMGTYSFAALRSVFGDQPEECLSCNVEVYKGNPLAEDKVDSSFNATFRFPNGGIGEAASTLSGPTIWTPSSLTVTHKAVAIPDEQLPPSQQKFRTRKVTLHGFIHAVVWHRLDIKDVFEIRNIEDGKVVKKWAENTSRKAYSFQEAGSEFADLPGEPFWMSYRHQLEQFVNRIRGRGTQCWVDAQDSIDQMRMIDMAYEKSGLGLRPSNKKKESC
ncbi:putative oxidoreductase [Xylaria sp. CBS 124048]|nr:putative oxidoreductase [Xylaria sp. CBS 124048]